MSLIRKHGAVLQAWACLDLVLVLMSHHSLNKNDVIQRMMYRMFFLGLRNVCPVYLKNKT